VKNTFTAFLLLFFFLFQNIRVSAQWNFSEGMDEVSCPSLLVMDSILFACTGGDGYYTRNINGGTWQQKFPSYYFAKILKAGNVLFGHETFSNYRSMDHGETWDTLGSFLEDSRSLATLDTTLFFTYDHFIYRSDDYGETYQPVFTTPQTGGFYLFGNDQSLFCWGYSLNHFYYSLTKGVTWDSLVRNGLPSSLYVYDIYNFNNEFWLAAALTWQSSSVYKWNPSTQTWQLNDTIPLEQFGIYNSALHAGGKYGFYRHDTTTNHWILLNTATEPSNILAFCSSDSLLFCGTGSGIYRSGPSYNWEAYYDGLHQADIRSMSSLDNEVLALSSYGIYRSTDFGSNFEKLPPPYPNSPLKLAINVSSFCMISYDGFSVSFDQGNSWITYNDGLPAGLIPEDLGVNSEFLFIISGHDIYRSSIAPVHWQKIKSDSITYFHYESLVCNDSVILVSVSRVINNTDFFYLYRSTDQGLTFDSITVGITNHVAAESLAYTGNNFFVFFDDFLFQTMDNGATWHQVQVPDTIKYLTGVTQNEQGMVISGCWWECNENYLFISFDNGISWTDIRGNLPNPAYGWLKPLESHDVRILTGVSSNGLWYNDYALTGQHEIIPQKNQTLKVAPNPAFDKIIITIDIEKDESGRLRICDLTGRTVYEGGIKEYRRGVYRTSIDIQNLDDGLYIISYNTNGKRIYGKFVKTVR
jgi:hypothetical protein